MMKKVIAIDGPSGAGKSTISQLLAQKLGFHFLDTGALYRAVGLYLVEKGLNENSSDHEISTALENIVISYLDGEVFIKYKPTTGNLSPDSFMDINLMEAIRTKQAGHYASVFSARKPVRAYLLHIQREAAYSSDIVAEGRDMTTVVFPDAWKKFYLDASEEERALRRHLQMKTKGDQITLEEALTDIRERDIRDMSRDIAPLKRSDDAKYINTSGKSIEDVIEEILSEIEG